MAVSIEWLRHKYGSVGRAAGAVALGIEAIPGEDFCALPENFRSLVAHKRELVLLQLAALAAGTSIQRLQEQWWVLDREEAEG